MKVIRLEKIQEENRGGYTIRRLLTEALKHRVENIGFYLTTIPAGSRVTRHYHPLALEVLVFLTSGTVKGEDEIHDFSAGDVVVLQPGEKHEIIAANDVKLIAARIPNFPDDKVIC